jgi:hypothetical protein
VKSLKKTYSQSNNKEQKFLDSDRKKKFFFVKKKKIVKTPGKTTSAMTETAKDFSSSLTEMTLAVYVVVVKVGKLHHS